MRPDPHEIRLAFIFETQYSSVIHSSVKNSARKASFQLNKRYEILFLSVTKVLFGRSIPSQLYRTENLHRGVCRAPQIKPRDRLLLFRTIYKRCESNQYSKVEPENHDIADKAD